MTGAPQARAARALALLSRQRMTDIDKLLADHQAIIDAWYANWLAEHKARVDALWARRRS